MTLFIHSLKSSSRRPPTRSSSLLGSKIELIEFALFFMGGLLNTIAYESLQPLILSTLVYFLCSSYLTFVLKHSYYEHRIFVRTFSICWFTAGIAAIYANILHDPSQNYLDAARFYEITSSTAINMSLADLSLLSEGSLAIVLWGYVYDLAAIIGIERERFVGVLFNVLVVSCAGILVIKISRNVFGNCDSRFRFLTLLYPNCGLVWLFASIHIRDAVVMFTITFLIHAWSIFLKRPSFDSALLYLFIVSLIGVFSLAFLRAEFVFVPFALYITAYFSSLFGKTSFSNSIFRFFFYVSGLIGLVIGYVIFASEITSFMVEGKDDYQSVGDMVSAADSLGMSLIVNQPAPIRLILGSIYLYTYPIPFWEGFQLESVYRLFKSLNVIYFYMVIPLLLISIVELVRDRNNRSAPIMFLMATSVAFTAAVAMTSMETRHLGAFLAPILIFAVVPDYTNSRIRSLYKIILMAILMCVFLLHLTWALLKVFM